MAISRKTACSILGVFFGLGFVALLSVAIAELTRFTPFYRDIECPEVPLAIPFTKFRLPPTLLPPGSPIVAPPYGLFGSILTTTSQCRNPNQVTATTKKEDLTSTLYVPDLSHWQWGTSEHIISSGKIAGEYLVVASGRLTDDYVLEAAGTGTSIIEITANTTIDKFYGLFGALPLTGYAPLYTKTVAKTESCMHLFGLEFCEKKDTITWCGALAGNCQTEVEIGNITTWVGGLCAYTNTICRLGGTKGEAEMKALVTAQNLGLTTVDVPCTSASGLPPSLNCPIVTQAAGINTTTGHQVSIPGLVDPPTPYYKEVQDAKYTVEAVIHMTMGISAIAAMCCVAPALKFWVVDPAAAFKKKRTFREESSEPGYPAILTSQPASKNGGDAIA
jgi:hypothetical protein